MVRMNLSGSAICAAFVGVSLLASGGQLNAVERLAAWVDVAPNHDWTDALNWDPNTIGGPRNTANSDFLVTIGCTGPECDTVTTYDPVIFNFATPAEITDFFLDNNSRLVLNPETDLTVVRTAEIAGIIDAQGGNFTAPDPEDPNPGSAEFIGDRARVYASDGSIVNIGAATYSSTGIWRSWDCSGAFGDQQCTTPLDLMTATGEGSLLDLSSVAVIDGGSTSGGNDFNQQMISALDGGTIDLSGVQTITAPVSGRDDIRFIASGAGSAMELSALATVGGAGSGGAYFGATGEETVLDMSSLGMITSAGSGRVFVDVANGGLMHTGNVNFNGVTATIDLNADSVLSVAGLQADEDSSVAITLITESDRLEASGSLLFGNEITIDAPVGGTVSVGGDFLYEHEDIADLSLALAHVECDGTSQRMEVGGTDFDLDWDFLDDNFGFEQLTVGQAGQATTVELVDLVDNHQECVPDALYLWGNEDTGLEGLRILGGSTLDIGHLNVYALLDVDSEGNTDGVLERTRIRDLFACGEAVIPFNHVGPEGPHDGFIAIDPAPVVLQEADRPSECDCAHSGYIDPRRESDNGVDLNQGITEITLCFSRPVWAIGGGDLTADAFDVRETGGGTPPGIVNVIALNDTRVTVTLDRPIALREWTTIQAHVEDECGNAIMDSGNQGPGVDEPDRVDIGFLPCDVDQSGTVSPLDLFRFRQFVNGIAAPDVGLLTEFIDTDRDGTLTPTDLFLFRQLINGVSPPATMPWAGASMNSPRP